MCAPSSSASTTCNSSSISTTDEPRVQTIQTAGSPEQREVDISNISHEDLQALREKDAFLYYSIPSVRRDELGFSDSSRSSRAASEETSASTTVKRCTRVSFECHTDLLMEDFLSEDLGFDEEELARIDLQLSRLFGLESGQ